MRHIFIAFASIFIASNVVLSAPIMDSGSEPKPPATVQTGKATGTLDTTIVDGVLKSITVGGEKIEIPAAWQDINLKKTAEGLKGKKVEVEWKIETSGGPKILSNKRIKEIK